MPDNAFLDTKVLVYAFSSGEPRKAITEDLMIPGSTVGVQTLNEFVNVERNKVGAPWSKVLDDTLTIRNPFARKKPH